jgi:protein required for attachment to host cells
MNNVWILVCDSAKARLFETRDGAPAWELLETMTHEESRSKASALVTDQAGSRSSEGATVHHNALAPGSEPKEVQKEHFAHSLGKTLDQARRSGRFGKWVLVAPPHFVGMLKKELSSELEKHLMATVDKDLTSLDVHALTDRLKDAVRIPVNEREVVFEPGPPKHAH